MRAAAARGAGPARRPRRRPGRPPGPSQAAALREALVAAATRQYAAAGRAGISFSALAGAVGLRKATVFHYFPAKDAVVQAVFAALGARLAERREAWFGGRPRSFARQLERVVGELVDFYERDPVYARVICHGLLEVPGLLPASGGEPSLARFVEAFMEFLRAGIAAGELHPGDPAGIMLAIGGVILFEEMIPPEARRAYGRGARTARRDEVVAFVRRALVNGGPT